MSRIFKFEYYRVALFQEQAILTNKKGAALIWGGSFLNLI